MNTVFGLVVIIAALILGQAGAAEFEPVQELPYRVAPDFFQLPPGMNFGEASAVALNSAGHIYLFHRANPMLVEFSPDGTFLRSVGDGLFDRPHGLLIDSSDHIWATDVGNQKGRVLVVLGHKGSGAEADWLFYKPADVAFGKKEESFVTDGYGNSRVVKFDRKGGFLKAWGRFGSDPGEFNLPHSIVTDDKGRVYVADRENKRIQIFDSEGNFLTQWTGMGYPYGLALSRDQHIWMADGGYDRIIELDPHGKILGALGEPGHAAGQLAGAHFLAVGDDRKLGNA
jgi:DNA-binding beta-propeller fold protein YncE